ncbi:MAG: tRNA (adenosine(37)-N6)-threonylcarbamoyltransferase complex ATPase subunit type 1 TsaE [Candidatus Paceibacterota bacterium]
MNIRTSTGDEMRATGAHFVRGLIPKKTATVVTLSGELGAGKTTFTQGIAHALGVEETVSSPTYVIEKIYALADKEWERLIHIDAYRLKSAHELDVLGWKDMLADPGAIIILEWPEKVAAAMPESALHISFEIHEEERILVFDGKEKDGV